MSGRSDQPCPFCLPASDKIFHAGSLILGLWDQFPVNKGHALLVPKRHVETWFDATPAEQRELVAGIDVARELIEQQYRPDGYNFGVNVGSAAGQTVFHLHLHVIPRYSGDMADPRGGIRHVVPARGNYTTSADYEGLVRDQEFIGAEDQAPQSTGVFSRPIVTGGDDHLLVHLRQHFLEAASVDLVVAFILESGLTLILEYLRDFLARGEKARIVTGTYLGVTEPNSLLKLLDLTEQYSQSIELRVFESPDQSFHPKAYIFHRSADHGIAFVGSSNLTRSGLTDGIEWNFRTVTSRDRTGFEAVKHAFESLWADPQLKSVDADWVDRYRAGRISRPTEIGIPFEAPEQPPEPHVIQQEALKALEATRRAGNAAGLVVLATGLGKTWLSAFDSNRPEFKRLLFVAHREEILQQAMQTFRRIRPEAHLGLYTGQEKTPTADIIFASVQTLGRLTHLERFQPAEFDYIVVDEFHHAAAKTYRRLIEYFDPRFLLGLTATPERTDGGDLLALCQENLVYRCDLTRGIEEALLCPFRYFGVPDEVNYANIPWRSSRFDEEALTQAVATQSRAQNALEQHRKRGGKRTLAFCCSTRHADFMRQSFRDAGLRAASVHSDATTDPRAESLEKLRDGEVDVVFAVDMFNEGVDLPDVDTVMMLRPTESRILWLQQFGRGLRQAEGKPGLTVIDYIGNHRTFLLKPQTLFDLRSGDAQIDALLTRIQNGEAELPPGCEVTYELEAVEILRALLRLPKAEEAVRFYYEDFRERHGMRPTASEMHQEGYNPRSVRHAYGSWFGFVDAMGDLGEQGQHLTHTGSTADFLNALESTQMTRSYKMLILRAMLDSGNFPGQMSIDELTAGVVHIAKKSAALQTDIGVDLDDAKAITRLLENNPIAAWTSGRGTGQHSYFDYSDGKFGTSFSVDDERREPFRELAAELVDWRLIEYLDRPALNTGERRTSTGLEVGRSYMREDIPPAFGLEFKQNVWQQGFVSQGEHIFLFVTLDKSGMPEEHRYGDRFLAQDLFEWKSQNRHTQQSAAGQKMQNHVSQGVQVLLFVRKTGKIGSKAAPFVYCGEVEFLDWGGERPITVKWRLQQPLSPHVAALFGVRGDQ